MFKIDKTFSSTANGLHVGSYSGVSKVPSCVLDEVIDLDASSLDNT